MNTPPTQPFPDHTPKLPDPPAGHRWEYRGMGADIEPGRIYICADDKRWDKTTSNCGSCADPELHYAEAVPITSEPNYQDRVYQREVLNAVFDGIPCEYFISSQGWVYGSLSEIVAVIVSGGKVRIKPEPTKKRVPLTPDDIPAVCWIRMNQDDACPVLVLQVSPDDVYFRTEYVNDSIGGDTRKTWDELLNEGWEYSEDRRNWKPCYKETVGEQ